MSGDLLNTLEEQCIFCFTGKVTIQDPKTHQFLGEGILVDGNLVYLTFRNRQGQKALFAVITEERAGESFKFLVEPGKFNAKAVHFDWKYSQIKEFTQREIGDAMAYAHLRPPAGRLLGTKAFRVFNWTLSKEEFGVLWDVAAFPKVEDLYGNSEFLDHQITRSLVRMRKLDIFSVF